MGPDAEENQLKTVGYGDQGLRFLARFGTSILRCLPPEAAHDLGMWLLEKGIMDILPRPSFEIDKSLAVSVPGIGHLAHPVGLAAGFDKNARCPGAFSKMGFSFLEVGTVTPRPQPGNPKPRMFRYSDQLGLINRMGFNSEGSEQVARRLEASLWNHDKIPLGVNLGKNKATQKEDALMDYVDGLKVFEPYGRYFVVNVSSPNTKGLRDLAGKDFLGLLAAQMKSFLPRVFVKLDPDMPKGEFQDLIAHIAKVGYQGVILCNTHRVEWPQAGGQSGHLLSSISQSRLEWAYEVHQGELLMIASGGIFSGADVFERLIRGASATQIYSALVYRGPFAVMEILEELYAEMRLRGFSCLKDAIGTYYQ